MRTTIRREALSVGVSAVLVGGALSAPAAAGASSGSVGNLYGPQSPLYVVSGAYSEPVWVDVTDESGNQASGPIPSGALQSLSNFRDVSGPAGQPLTTSDGRTVKSGLAYRSNSLHRAADSDLANMVAAGVTEVIDLRNAKERSEDPDRIPVGVAYTVADLVDLSQGVFFDESPVVTIAPTLVDKVPAAVTDEQERKDLGQLLGYQLMATNSASHRAIADTFRSLIDADGAVVFHCSAGKDRTGLVAAFLLRILGVDLADIDADFLASNSYLGREDSVKLEWPHATWNDIDRVYGSFDAFVSGPLGLNKADISKLRGDYLQ